MCLIVFAFQYHREYPLIVAANRDEFFHRPTQAASFWDQESDILAGRDLQAGGTWLGITRQGHFSALTNYRDGSNGDHYSISRGELPLKHLRNPKAMELTLQQVQQQRHNYNGFNLLLGDSSRLAYVSNRGDTPSEFLQPGIYGLSNALLNTPWPKVISAREELLKITKRDWGDLPSRQDELFQLLADERQARDAELPRTGVSLESERMLSSRFISSPDYGTRSSTLALFHHSGRIHFLERQYQYRRVLSTQEYILAASGQLYDQLRPSPNRRV